MEVLNEYARKYKRLFIADSNGLADKHAIVIVHHYNRALKLLEKTGIRFDYYLFHADDCVYPKDYVERLFARMQQDKVDVASGDWGVPSPVDRRKAPQGAGRMVSRNVMQALRFGFPKVYGYESYLLHKAEQLGFRLANYGDIHYELLNPLGLEAWHPTPGDTPDMPQGGHVFYEWGLGMRCLAYHPLYAISRLVSDLLWNRSIPKVSALVIAWDYFSTYWNPSIFSDPYFHLLEREDDDYKRFMKRKQVLRIGQALSLPMRMIAK